MTDKGEIEAEVVSSDISSLIQGYEEARSNAGYARRTVLGALILILTVNAAFAIYLGQDFFRNRTGEFAAALATNMSKVVSMHSPRISQVVQNVYPEYIHEFRVMSDREFPRLLKAVEAQLVKLQQHADSKKPEIHARLEKLVMGRLEQAVSRLEKASGKKLTEAESKRISELYRTRIRERADEAFHRAFTDHQTVVQQLERSLKRLENSEPDLAKDIHPEEAVGILLEFAGVELQSEADLGNVAARAMLSSAY